ncbi:MAG TPA: ATPase, T2SS/T4P/T4SS family [Candidatus Baltobacteraceae bacterium]|nr:ATPase, T2SS/T4P/T4SS family [Candidatus Baltobacteraceae bacterium]
MGVLDHYEAELTDDPASVFEACEVARTRFPLVNGLSRCSDVHVALSFGAIMHRVDGELVPMEGVKLPSKPALEKFIQDHMSTNDFIAEQLKDFGAASLSHWGDKIGRLRVTVLQTHEPTLQIRLLPDEPPPWEALRLPSEVRRFAENRRGIGFVAGRVSSGKSTVLAASTDSIVRERPDAVLSVDDTQEYKYRRRKGIVYSVELGQPGQAKTYATALKNSLRSDINALIIGESRTPDVLDVALQTAVAGPRTATTVHVRGALAVPDRIIGAFPSDAQPQVRQMLAGALEEVLYITLVRAKDESVGRVPAVEFLFRLDDLADVILDDTNRTANSIETGLKNYMEKHDKDGMILLEDHLLKLVDGEDITRETALGAALRPDVMRRKLKLDEGSDRRTILTKDSSRGFTI